MPKAIFGWNRDNDDSSEALKIEDFCFRLLVFSLYTDFYAGTLIIL